VIIDLGTGDGRAVLAAAAADPEAFVLGIDADARAPAEASRRVARGARSADDRRAWFVAAGVEMLPAGLTGLADLVTVRFPWGSLLRGVLGIDSGVATSIARLLAPGGHLEITLSLVAGDRHDTAGVGFGAADIERMAATFATLGLTRTAARPLSAAEVAAIPSTWARRLRAGDGGTARPVWQVSFEAAPPEWTAGRGALR
jgi:16S rRNA (adenine(1408)-N(1))-methyltransferase